MKMVKMFYFELMSRLSIEISSEQHQKIKALAALQGKSIKDYILNELFSAENEQEQAALSELEKLLLTRIEQAENSPVSSKTIQQITDGVLRGHQSSGVS